MIKKAFLVLFFGCLGITCEIFMVAFSNLITGTQLFNEPIWSLTGKSYVWMFPIYALIPVLGGPIMKKFKALPLIIRLFIYAGIIYIVEFSSGFLLEQLTGKCPWEYTTGWHLMGYIRLDYIPLWMAFAYLVESLYFFLDKRL
jgi:hypothetical protein